LLNFNIFLTLLITFLPWLAYTLLIPTYSLYLMDTLDISASFTGYLLGINAISFIICAPITSYLSPRINRKLLIFCSLIAAAVSSGMIGDPKYLGLNNTLTI
jgi:MFS family permease